MQPVADVDAGRADGDALVTVHAVAAPFPALAFPVLAARLTAPAFVGDDSRVLVEHGRLKPWPRAHVSANLLPCPAGQQVGGGREQAEEEKGDGRRLASDDLFHDGRCVDEIHDPSPAGERGNHQPNAMLDGLLGRLVETHRTGVELDAGVAISFDATLDPHVEVGPHGLWAGVATPDPSGEAGDKKKAESGEQ